MKKKNSGEDWLTLRYCNPVPLAPGALVPAPIGRSEPHPSPSDCCGPAPGSGLRLSGLALQGVVPRKLLRMLIPCTPSVMSRLWPTSHAAVALTCIHGIVRVGIAVTVPLVFCVDGKPV